MSQAPTPTAPRGYDTGRARLRAAPADPLLAAFARVVRDRPLAPLVLAGDRRATAEEIDALARAAARVLTRDGLPARDAAHGAVSARRGAVATSAPEPGAVVAVAVENGPALLAALLAARRLGLAALLLDGRAPAAEVRRVAVALRATAILRGGTSWPTGSAADWQASPVAAGGAGSAGTESAGRGEADRCDGGEALHLPGTAVIKLTSGSTGEPRGIAASSEALLADEAALWSTMGLRHDDRLVAAIPMSHSYGLSSLALPALVRGMALVMPEDAEAGTGLGGPLAAAQRWHATVLPTVPAYLDALLRLADAPRCPPSLRLVVTAGAPLTAATAAGFRAAYGLPVHVFYGASECGGICYDREGGAAERGTVGTPVDGVTLTLQAAGDGDDATGVITVRSAAVASAYVPQPDARLVGGRFLAGDLGVWRDGELALLGRQDGLVNIKGHKVNPREVETILGELAGVADAAVLGVPIGHGGGAVLRAVVACDPARLSRREVLAWCRERLAAHKVPRSLILVRDIPRNGRGKADRAALLALQPAPGDGAEHG